jgi:hypothetical protein
MSVFMWRHSAPEASEFEECIPSHLGSCILERLEQDGHIAALELLVRVTAL